MTTASEFRASALLRLHHQDAADMLTDLPAETFDPTVRAMTALQLSGVMPWMDELSRKRAIRAAEIPTLRLAYSMLSVRARDQLDGKESTTLWRDRIRVEDSEIQGWVRAVTRDVPSACRWAWRDQDRETHARVALALTDEQIDQLQKALKC